MTQRTCTSSTKPLREINAYVARRVRELTGGAQTPTTVWLSKTTSNFALVGY